ncbi:MAG: 30S ribosomal protein S13 [Candidatus Buchananbacteria bacterium]|nr:30S ribosomal protein S13 [Candidatus Buchananbacteria bacterium]
MALVRIVGVTIPQDKRIAIALTYIYGIGRSRAAEILKELKIDPNTKTKDLTNEEENKLRDYIRKNFKVEGDLKREVMGNIKRLKEIKTYKGTRHSKRLPVRGQRTKTNSRTVKGNVKMTLGSGRKPPAQKT